MGCGRWLPKMAAIIFFLLVCTCYSTCQEVGSLLPWIWAGFVTCLSRRIWWRGSEVEPVQGLALKRPASFPFVSGGSRSPCKWFDYLKQPCSEKAQSSPRARPCARSRRHQIGARGPRGLSIQPRPAQSTAECSQASDTIWCPVEQKNDPAEPCPNSWPTELWEIINCFSATEFLEKEADNDDLSFQT